MQDEAANSFLSRYALSFGKKEALLLRLAGFSEAEVRAEGAAVWDANGKPWLDFGSFGIHLLGHRHPRVIEEAKQQLDLMGLSTKVLGSAQALSCAETLAEHSPPNIDRVVYANSGGEAIDIALKLVIAATGRKHIVALKHSYHGKTLGALAVSDALPDDQRPGGAIRAEFIDPDLDQLTTLLQTGQFAAFIVEPIQGEGGIRPISQEFLRGARDACTAHDVLLVLDEIQTGLGRCGNIWRSAMSTRPDILVAGKTLGGGLVPIAAVLFDSSKVAGKTLDPLLLASSFAGGSFATRIAQTVLAIVSEEQFQEEVRALGETALSYLRDGVGNNTKVREVRGEGLMIGIEFESAGSTGHVIATAARRNLLLTFCLHEPKVLRVYPPATTSEAELSRGLEVLADAIASLPTIERAQN